MSLFSVLLNNADMKTIEQIHRDNLAFLVVENGSASLVAKMVGVSDSQFSQWLNGSKNSGTGKPRGMRPASCRKIEEKCGKPVGWMDVVNKSEIDPMRSKVTAIHPDDPRPDDVVYVLESRIEFSGGNGRVATYELVEDEEPATYRLSWFQKYGINPDKVRRFRVSGRSMEPMLYPRDTILVNTEETSIIDGKLYAIRYGDELRVKYLSRRLDGTLILRSVNPDYKDEDVAPDLASEHITIIGRVRDTSGTGGL